MADPSAYVQNYNFSGYQAVNPSSPLPGSQVDIQFAAIEESTSGIVSAIQDIRRADGQLANQSVGPDQLSAALSIGFTNRGAWATATAYSAGDGVVYGETFYKALVAHTSSAPTRPDGDAVTWSFLFTFSSVTTSDGSITPAKLSSDASGFQSKIGLGSLAVEDVTYLASAVAGATEKTLPVDDDKLGLVDSADADALKMFKWSSLVAAVTAAIGQSRYIGEVIKLSGPTLPALCLYPYGQNISRTTYAAYFAEVGTTYGVGDGSTTFAMPDYRGRALVGKDNMGGVSANRLTGLSGGLNGDNLGAAGGVETHTLTTAQLAVHGHARGTYTAASHAHTVGPYEHRHGLSGDGSSPNWSDGDTGGGSHSATTSLSGALTVSGTSANAGSGSAHNNVQPSIVCNVAIFVGV